MLTPWKKSYDQPRQHIEKQRHYFANKGPSSKAMVFPVVMYGCESWTIKKAERWRIDAFELWCWRRLLRSRLDCKEIQPVHPKWDLSWVFIAGTDVEAETPILWPPDGKSWLIWKDPDAGKDWGLWDLSSPTRDGTCVPFIGRWILSHRTTWEVSEFLLNIWCIRLYFKVNSMCWQSTIYLEFINEFKIF